MDIHQHHVRETTRRHFFANAGVSVGSLALASLMSDDGLLQGKAKAAIALGRARNSLGPQPTHFTATAKHVVFLFMAGGPSHLELFDYKPKLQELDCR